MRSLVEKLAIINGYSRIVQTIDGSIYSIWSHHWLHKAMALPGTLVEIIADKIDKQIHTITKLNHRIMPLHGEVHTKAPNT